MPRAVGLAWAMLRLSLELSFDVAELYGRVHPLSDELLESLVIADLCSHRRELWSPDEAGSALTFPAPAQLLVGPVLLGWVRLAAAAWSSAHVVLLGKDSGT